VLILSPDQITAIKTQAEQAYPQECCGLLLGSLKRENNTDIKAIAALYPIANTWGDPENPLADGETSQRRFLIDPAAFKQGHDYAYRQGLGVVGTYHSHPNHAAVPSDFDRQHAFPWGFSCVIVSVHNGVAAEVCSWILDEQEQPQPEPLLTSLP
jgi:proteasome lid subunit RPN8/RPN11